MALAVVDVNDNIPSCTLDVVVVSKREDLAVGSLITTLTCSDLLVQPLSPPSSPFHVFRQPCFRDSGVNGLLVYSIVSVNSNPAATPFSMNSTHGVLSLVNSLNYESTTLYAIAVLVTDSGSPSLSIAVKVCLTITGSSKRAAF